MLCECPCQAARAGASKGWLQHHNAALGASLHLRDKDLDRMHKEATATFGNRIEQSNDRSQDYLHLILVVRSLKRVGDRAVNIGEDAVFLETPRDLRHLSNRELE